MTSRPPAPVRLAGELRRRRVFTTAGLYAVSSWLVMQVADVDRQWAVVEEIDAEEDFQSLLDKVRESKQPTAAEDTGGR